MLPQVDLPFFLSNALKKKRKEKREGRKGDDDLKSYRILEPEMLFKQWSSSSTLIFSDDGDGNDGWK